MAQRRLNYKLYIRSDHRKYPRAILQTIIFAKFILAFLAYKFPILQREPNVTHNFTMRTT